MKVEHSYVTNKNIIMLMEVGFAVKNDSSKF